MIELTKAEEQIMQVLWKLEKGVVRDLLDELPEPKPAYNTVSTVVRILEKKGAVDHDAYGKTHVYFPLMTKENYREYKMKGLMKNYFSDNPKALVSYLVESENIDLNELDEILELIKNKDDK